MLEKQCVSFSFPSLPFSSLPLLPSFHPSLPPFLLYFLLSIHLLPVSGKMRSNFWSAIVHSTPLRRAGWMSSPSTRMAWWVWASPLGFCVWDQMLLSALCQHSPVKKSSWLCFVMPLSGKPAREYMFWTSVIQFKSYPDLMTFSERSWNLDRFFRLQSTFRGSVIGHYCREKPQF